MQKEGVWTTVWPPISLCTIGAMLRDADFDVKIHDCPVEGIDQEGLRAIIRDYRPDLLITNSSTPSIKHDLAIPALAKATFPPVKVAAFGIHVGILSEEVMQSAPELDYIIRGEPEFTALELAQALASGINPQNIPGLSLRLNGSVRHFPDRSFYPDLDALPFPAWDLVNLDKYRLPFNRRKFVMVMSSRGCPYDCTFCVAQSYYGKKIRKRSARRIVDEIEWNIRQNGISDFFFWSESFTILKKNIVELCDEILKRGLKIKWVCNSRADNIDRQMLEKMKSAGCWMISYGVESGEQSILDRAQKRITIDQMREAVKLTRQFGFQIAGHFVLGLPGETEESLKKTEKLALELDLDYAQFYCASPWPGSRFFNEAKREGWLNTYDWDKYEQSFCVLDYPELSGQRIMEIRDKMTKAFYYRPKIVWKTLKKISSPAEFKNFMGMVKDYLTWI
jgi:radical SAM superfamily enzyme YgiQ (UPF0313 family)